MGLGSSRASALTCSVKSRPNMDGAIRLYVNTLRFPSHHRRTQRSQGSRGFITAINPLLRASRLNMWKTTDVDSKVAT